MRSINLSQFNRFIESGTAIVGAMKENFKYEANQKTDQITSISMGLHTEFFGELQVVWAYKDGLLELLKSQYPFATVVKINDLGIVTDIRLSIYKDALVIKIFVD